MSTTSYWDPFGDEINQDALTAQHSKLRQQYSFYKEHPGRIATVSFWLWIIPFVAFTLLILSGEIYPGSIFFTAVIGITPIIIYKSYISGVEQNLVLMSLCEKHSWIFLPEHDSKRMHKLMSEYPEIFNIGHSNVISDQIWGSDSHFNLQFWRSNYKYTTGSGKYRTNHYLSLYAVRLPVKIIVPFFLYRSSLPMFSSKLQTESVDFNKRYSIYYKSESALAENEIMQILNPSVQVRLIEIGKKFPVQSVYFQNDVMLMVFQEGPLRTKFTKFANDVSIDNRDVDLISQRLAIIHDILQEIVPYTD